MLSLSEIRFRIIFSRPICAGGEGYGHCSTRGLGRTAIHSALLHELFITSEPLYDIPKDLYRRLLKLERSSLDRLRLRCLGPDSYSE